MENNDLFVNNKLLTSNLLLKNQSLFSTFKLSLRCRKKSLLPWFPSFVSSPSFCSLCCQVFLCPSSYLTHFLPSFHSPQFGHSLIACDNETVVRLIFTGAMNSFSLTERSQHFWALTSWQKHIHTENQKRLLSIIFKMDKYEIGCKKLGYYVFHTCTIKIHFHLLYFLLS